MMCFWRDEKTRFGFASDEREADRHLRKRER